jgi:hypothetical protein
VTGDGRYSVRFNGRGHERFVELPPLPAYVPEIEQAREEAVHSHPLLSIVIQVVGSRGMHQSLANELHVDMVIRGCATIYCTRSGVATSRPSSTHRDSQCLPRLRSDIRTRVLSHWWRSIRIDGSMSNSRNYVHILTLTSTWSKTQASYQNLNRSKQATFRRSKKWSRRCYKAAGTRASNQILSQVCPLSLKPLSPTHRASHIYTARKH